MKIRLLVCFFVFTSFCGYGQCTLDVTISSSASAICSGSNITLTAKITGGTGPYSYAWSTGEVTPSIIINRAGTYTVTASGKAPGCPSKTASITIASNAAPDPPTAKPVVVCANSLATLTATAPGGFYQWYDASGTLVGTGPSFTTAQPVTAPTSYFVETTIGGCTSSRTQVNVSLIGRPSVTGAEVCVGNVATLTATGGDSYAWYASTTSTTPLSSDATFVTPVLTATKTYYVVATTNGCPSVRTPVVATVSQPPSPPTIPNQNVHICSGTSASLHADAPAGIFDWFTVPSGGTSLISSPDYTTPPLTANTTYYVQTSINDCVSARVAVNVIIDAPPIAPIAQSPTICYNTSATLNATANPAGVYKWFTTATGGNAFFTGPTYTTPDLTANTTYYVQAVNGACTSERAQINVVVKPLLSGPAVPGAVICSGETTSLTATSQGGTYNWYAAPTGGLPLFNGPTFNTPALTTTTTYYVDRTFDGCTSPRAPVTVSVLPMPAAPTVANTSVCSGNPASIIANSPSNIYAWYDSPTGGTLLSNGQVLVTPPLTVATTYYVETQNANGCTSQRKAVTVTVNNVPPPPTVTNPPICPGSRATLTANVAAGITVKWYADATGGNPIFTGATFVTPALTTATTYYVQAFTSTCPSDRVPVTVTIIPGYSPEFKYSSGTYCATSANPVPVINNPAGGTFSVNSPGLVFVSTTTGEINMAASSVGRYVITFTSNGACGGTSRAKLSIVNNTDPSFSYNGPYCQDDNNPFPTFTATSTAGTFTATPAGLVFVNSSTGEIDLANSAAGTYSVINTINASGTCLKTVSPPVIVVINRQVLVNAGPNQNVPKGSVVQLAGNISGAITTGRWTGGTGTFSNPADPNATYTPGPGENVANLTLTSDLPANGCSSKAARVVITFINVPQLPTVPGVEICTGSAATLSATAPGGFYKWYANATDVTSIATGPSFTTPPLLANTTYYVETTVNDITSGRTAVTVIVDPVPAPPTVSVPPVCVGDKAILQASGNATGSYAWYASATDINPIATGPTFTTVPLFTNTTFYVEIKNNRCVSTRIPVNVVVNPVPNITSVSTGSTCSGNAINYTITADQPATTFTWSRAVVPGISNPAITGQTSSTINETLINTSGNTLTVTYVITALSGSCPGPSFNYVVTVYPQPVITTLPPAPICNGNPVNYNIAFNTNGGVSFTWDRAAVPGISNAAVSGQTSPVIKEVLFNTTNAPIDVIYVINYKTGTCDGVPLNLKVTVNPTAVITSIPKSTACTGYPVGYAITSNIPTATYNWSRLAVGVNPAVTNQTSSTIDEILINNGTNPITASYTITPFAYGCPGTPFELLVSINPPIYKPDANGTTPVCVGSTIHLSTVAVPGATYLWTFPDGTTSTDQNPDIKNVKLTNAGIYKLVTTIRGCDSKPGFATVEVDEPSKADAGPAPAIVCGLATSITLHGSVKYPDGTDGTGIWTTSGNGKFSQVNSVDNVQYNFTPEDKANGSVTLTLTTTNKSDCMPSSSSRTIKFGPLPAVNAGPDQNVCAKDNVVKMAGIDLIPGNILWTPIDGTGRFDSPNQPDANYIPSADDIKNGSVKLMLTNTNLSECYIASDTMVVKFIQPPTVDAGGVRYVLRGQTITLNPTVSSPNATYKWSPDIDISDVNVRNPVVTGNVNRFYILTVTDERNCPSSDTTLVVVSPEIKINNTFTPNGDGINDLWEITGLVAYRDATVDIFNRYGQKLFHSVGYPKAWDGTYNGKPLPAGVYYYIVDTKVNSQVLSGYVTIIR